LIRGLFYINLGAAFTFMFLVAALSEYYPILWVGVGLATMNMVLLVPATVYVLRRGY